MKGLAYSTKARLFWDFVYLFLTFISHSLNFLSPFSLFISGRYLFSISLSLPYLCFKSLPLFLSLYFNASIFLSLSLFQCLHLSLSHLRSESLFLSSFSVFSCLFLSSLFTCFTSSFCLCRKFVYFPICFLLPALSLSFSFSLRLLPQFV